MKNYLKIACLLALLLVAACSTERALPRDTQIERRIGALLKKMSLEEKVGQMTQLTLDVVVSRGDGTWKLDSVMVDSIFNHYKVGSILNLPLDTPLTPGQWHAVVRELQRASIAATGIPILYGLDQVHGAGYTIGATLFPQQIGMAATFDPQQVRRAAQITAYETRAGSIPWNFSPVLDLGRDARWPRQWETYGEDSHLAAVMGAACVEGYQGDDPGRIGPHSVAACLKHFMGYGVPASGKDRTPSYISPREMRERHFAPFEAAIRAGALSVMVNSGLNDGLPLHADRRYITGWLKRGLRWDGVVVSDWADIYNLHTRDKVAASKKQAVEMAVNAGIDMAMVPYDPGFCTLLRELVEEGRVSMARIDDAVRRILRLKMRLGLFDRPWSDPDAFPEFGGDTYAAMARRAAVESITLLKNDDGLLPLSEGKRVLVAGPAAHSMRALNGGWTLSWQGEKSPLHTSRHNTILEAVQQRVGARNTIYEPGITYREGDPPTSSIPYQAENEPQIARCVAAARRADYVILCLGENSYCETKGNLSSLELSAAQRELALALAATGKPIVLVLVEGRPRVIADIVPRMAAVMQSYLPGNHGGDALAALLWGDENPSGRLPYTYPNASNSLITYDHKPGEQIEKMGGAYDYDARADVQWPFGHGLSYTSWEYSDFTLDKERFTPSDTLFFSLRAANTGPRDGRETVMLFSSDLYASLSPDVRRLRAFEKVEVEAGGSRTVRFALPASELAFTGLDGRRVVEEGTFRFQCGDRAVEAFCTTSRKF